MSKMSRLIRGELNKILMRPILYVITGILVVALIFSFTIFNPTERKDSEYSVGGTTNTEAFTNFTTHTGTMNKSVADTQVDTAQILINYYQNLKIPANKYTTKFSEIDTLDSIMSAYSANIYNASSNIANCNYNRNQLINVLTTFRTNFNEAVSNPNLCIMIKTDNIDTITSLVQKALSRLNNEDYDYSNLDVHETVYNYLINNKIFEQLVTLTNEIKDIEISDETLTKLNLMLTTTRTNLTTRYQEINSNYTSSDYQLETLKDDIRDYYQCAGQLLTLVQTTLQYEPIKNLADSVSHTYNTYANIYSYQLQETITKCTYLIENNAVSSDYAMMYNAVITSNSETNAFDFVYYGLELCGFIIIIFCVVIGAGMVAGEQTNGTLKLLAIRPFSRNKILTSKLWATLIFGIIFTLFSAIILFITGYIFYGIDFTSVLGIFNATTAFVMSPFWIILIYLACLIFKIFIYTLIAITISVIFRSNVGAVGISIFIYFFSALFGVLFTTSYWYAYLPFSNFDLFKYLGGSFASSQANPLAIAFSSGIYYNMNFIWSAVISGIFIVLLLILTYVQFNKREIK